MANGGSFVFQAAGWSEFDQPEDVYWYEGQPPANVEDPNPFATIPSTVSPADVEGIWVHAYDLDDPDNEHWFWVRSYMELESWDQWYDLISLTMDMHSMGLA